MGSTIMYFAIYRYLYTSVFFRIFKGFVYCDHLKTIIPLDTTFQLVLIRGEVLTVALLICMLRVVGQTSVMFIFRFFTSLRWPLITIAHRSSYCGLYIVDVS